MPTISVTETTIERGEPGQTIHVIAVGLTLTAIAGDYTLSNGGVVSSVSLTDPTDAVLTVTAPTSDGTTALTTQATTSSDITISDTTAPPQPTGLWVSAPTAVYSVPTTWNSQADTYGGTVTFTAKKNGTTVASGIAGTTHTFTGVSDGDTLAILAVDGDGNASVIDSLVFHAPSPSIGLSEGAFLG